MADSYNKKELEKKKRKRRKDKAEKKEQRKQDGRETPEFMYMDEFGNLSPTPPDPSKKRAIKAEDIDVSTPKKGKSEQPNFLRTGVVKFFNTEKGYGFIIDSETEESVFVHINNLDGPVRENDQVMFEVEMGPKGANAVNVKMVEQV